MRTSFERRRHLTNLTRGAGRKYDTDVGISFENFGDVTIDLGSMLGFRMRNIPPALAQDSMENPGLVVCLGRLLIAVLTLYHCAEIGRFANGAAIRQPKGADDALALQGDERLEGLVIEVELIGLMDEVKINVVPFQPFENSPRVQVVCMSCAAFGAEPRAPDHCPACRRAIS